MGVDEPIAARRTYGRVDEHDGEYVETEFTYLGWLRIPLAPQRSFWIADDRGGQRTGFPIQLHPRSVAATYLRIWAPGIATAVLVLGSSSLATAIAATLFGLSAWSWTWWPRDAALRRRSDFDLAAFGSRCDPARMTDEMHRSLASQLAVRAGAQADPRPPDDVVRYGARTVDEALFAYGCLRLRDLRSPSLGSPSRFSGAGGAGWMISRRRRPRGGPYRDRSAASAPELWAMLSDSAQACATERRAGPLRSHPAVPGPALVLPAFARNPWIWLAVLAVSTVVSGFALAGSWQALAPPPVEQPRAVPHPEPRAVPHPEPRAVPHPEPHPVPHLMSGDELTRAPIGDYIAVQCDYVQNSDSGRLRRVTLCVVGQHILAVAGGNRRHDDGRRLQGYVEAIPDGEVPSWASALHRQSWADMRYFHFYLRRISYGDDTPDDAEDVIRWDPDPRFAVPSDYRGEQHRGGDDMGEVLCRALVVAASLATLAGWFVWIRLWQHRRRVAAWLIPD